MLSHTSDCRPCPGATIVAQLLRGPLASETLDESSMLGGALTSWSAPLRVTAFASNKVLLRRRVRNTTVEGVDVRTERAGGIRCGSRLTTA